MFIQIVLIAITYFVTGKLGLLLALPPGYATLMWPPTGLSIAALLIFGLNRWPGILLGAFLINLRDFSISQIGASFAVAVVASFGLWMGSFIAKKFISFPKPFYSERNIILFLFVVGPLTALLTSTFSTGILFLTKKIEMELVFQNWLYWFIGDATGGIIFAPLALMLALPSRPYWIKALPKVILPLLAFMGLSILGARYYQNNEKLKQLNEFQAKSKMAFGILERDLNTHFARIEILTRFFNNSDVVTEPEFFNFSNALLDGRPELHTFMWFELNPRSQWKYGPKFINSQEGHIIHLHDLLSKNEIQETVSTINPVKNHIHTSSLINLNFIGINEPGYILAGYSDQPPGIILGIIRINKILEHIKSFISAPEYRTIIEQIESEKKSSIVIDSHANSQGHFPKKSDFTWSSEMEVGGHKWRVTFAQNELFSNKLEIPNLFIVLTPLNLTFLTCTLLLILFSRVITIDEQVREKTKNLQDLNKNLTLASKTKSEFLANMSHEIRTPLNILIGMPDLLDESNLTSEQRRYLEISRKAGNNLLHIINDILDLSKIESGQITLETSAFSVHDLVRDTIDLFSVKCQDKNIQITSEISQELAPYYLGDSTRIRQILSNLISNAIKFTHQGTILIKAYPNKDSSRPGTVLFEVVDTGIGIPPDKINSLFRPFTQADSSITRKYGGTGLGLSICKRLTEMMNGTIQVQSEVHQGSTFSFTLDLAATQAQKDHDLSSPKLSTYDTSEIKTHQKLKILIVDDTDDNRMLIKAFLKKSPHELFEANNGEEALEFVKTNHPDLILMDMQMPVMDGYTATKAIREYEKTNHLEPAKIWALTAYALKNEVQKSIQAGCNLHLVKPIRRNELISEIQKLTI